MQMNLLIFEDEKSINLNPLVLNKPVYELLCGMASMRKKIENLWPTLNVLLHCRRILTKVMAEANHKVTINLSPSDKCVLVNGRLLANAALVPQINLDAEAVYVAHDSVVAAVLPKQYIPHTQIKNGELLTIDDFPRQNRRKIDAQLIEYPWDLIHANPGQIKAEFEGGGRIEGRVHPNAILLNEQAIHIGEGSEVGPGVILDAEGGPIFISKNAKIMANAVIEGPCFIGESTTIKIGAKIYEGCSFGKVCKIGGEVEESIVHAYSNKQHEGFLGHAYVGEWCNLGADTNNSDLKNNYSNVKVQINDGLVDSGSLFVGLFMADHSKSGINTMFNTGTVVGVGCNVYGADFSPRFIPSFHWGGGSSGTIKYDFDKIMDTARKVMARRNKNLTKAMVRLYQSLYNAEQPKILDKKRV
jgi:UDP-N-acetylglucosamine diphosphorylase/glucosamine-1-phosphate N-acetyltransferase